MNLLLDILLENIRIVSYMFSVVFSAYIVTDYSNEFLAVFRNPFVRVMIGTFLAMSMIDFRKNTFMVNMINLISTTILFVIMLYVIKKITNNKKEKNE